MMAREILHVMKLTPEAIVPVRGSTLAAGLDLARLVHRSIDEIKVTYYKTHIQMYVARMTV